MGFIQEFKEFALKGNVIDMAVGIIIGAAFNKIVTSLVQDVVMPPIGLMIGGVDFKNLQWVLKPEIKDAAGTVTQQLVAIRYGMFLNNVIEFLIVALTVFIVVKVMVRVISQRMSMMTQAVGSRLGFAQPAAPPTQDPKA